MLRHLFSTIICIGLFLTTNVAQGAWTNSYCYLGCNAKACANNPKLAQQCDDNCANKSLIKNCLTALKKQNVKPQPAPAAKESPDQAKRLIAAIEAETYLGWRNDLLDEMNKKISAIVTDQKFNDDLARAQNDIEINKARIPHLVDGLWDRMKAEDPNFNEIMAKIATKETEVAKADISIVPEKYVQKAELITSLLSYVPTSQTKKVAELMQAGLQQGKEFQAKIADYKKKGPKEEIEKLKAELKAASDKLLNANKLIGKIDVTKKQPAKVEYALSMDVITSAILAAEKRLLKIMDDNVGQQEAVIKQYSTALDEYNQRIEQNFKQAQCKMDKMTPIVLAQIMDCKKAIVSNFPKTGSCSAIDPNSNIEQANKCAQSLGVKPAISEAKIEIDPIESIIQEDEPTVTQEDAQADEPTDEDALSPELAQAQTAYAAEKERYTNLSAEIQAWHEQIGESISPAQKKYYDKFLRMNKVAEKCINVSEDDLQKMLSCAKLLSNNSATFEYMLNNEFAN